MRLPLAALGGVLRLGAGVEPGEGGEGVGPGPAGPGEGAHQAGDAAQGGAGVGGQRGVRQQIQNQVPRLVNDREVHPTPAERALNTHAHTYTQMHAHAYTHTQETKRHSADRAGTHAFFPHLPPSTVTRSLLHIYMLLG